MKIGSYLMLNKSLMQILANTNRPPPPIPCITRPASSICILILKAAMREPIKKIALANNMIGLRPKISLIFPHVGVVAAIARRKADPIHV